MGRGSSKIGGGGGIAQNITTNDVAKLSDTNLMNLDKALQSQITLMNNRLASIARDNPAYNMPQEYYDIQNEKSQIQSQHSIVMAEIVKRKPKTSNQNRTKTFVNSFGDATQRNITTASYKRAQKRLSQQIMRFIGG